VKARNAVKRSQHVRAMEEIELACPPMKAYLDSISKDGHEWRVCAAAEKHIPLFGMRSDNIVEQVFSFILDEGSLSPFYFIKCVTEKLFDQMGHQHAAAMSRQELLTMPAQVKWSESRSHVEGSSEAPGTAYTVAFTTADCTIARVTKTCKDGHRAPENRVELDKRFCTCLKWTQHGVPCSHAYVVLKEKGLFKAGEVLTRTYDTYFAKLCFTVNHQEMFKIGDFKYLLSPAFDEVYDYWKDESSPITCW